ncbi:unnamed protein product, partial [Didymodactylos carnosus]
LLEPIEQHRSQHPRTSTDDNESTLKPKETKTGKVDDKLQHLYTTLEELENEQAELKHKLGSSNLLSEENKRFKEENKMIRHEMSNVKMTRLPEPTSPVYEWIHGVLDHVKTVEDLKKTELDVASVMLPSTAQQVKQCLQNDDWKKTARNLIKACYPDEKFKNFTEFEAQHRTEATGILSEHPFLFIKRLNRYVFILEFLQAAFPFEGSTVTYTGLAVAISDMCRKRLYNDHKRNGTLQAQTTVQEQLGLSTLSTNEIVD